VAEAEAADSIVSVKHGTAFGRESKIPRKSVR